MNLKYEDQISRYFDRHMSSGEEQSFLISLAASDEMRIQFRSHLELAKALKNDKESMASQVPVRARTFAALGIAMGTLPLTAQEAQSAIARPKSTFMGFVKGHALSMVLGVGLGVTGAAIVSNSSSNESPVQPQAVATAPANQTFTAPAVINDAQPTVAEEAKPLRTVVRSQPSLVGPAIVKQLPKATVQEQSIPVVDRKGSNTVTIKPDIKQPAR